MEEKNLRVCKICLTVKERIHKGKYPNNKDKRYIDANGGQWNGSTCADCHKIKMKERMRTKRAK
jgi:hypothetical protein